jgi:hypothetical protein
MILLHYGLLYVCRYIHFNTTPGMICCEELDGCNPIFQWEMHVFRFLLCNYRKRFNILLGSGNLIVNLDEYYHFKEVCPPWIQYLTTGALVQKIICSKKASNVSRR